MTERIHSYPKVYSMGHPAIRDLFDGTFVVEEKVDGSQFSFMLGPHGLRFRSKNAEVHMDAGGMFEQAVAAVRRRVGLLTQGFVYRAEYLMRPKHNALTYNRTPKNSLVIFDVETSPNTFMLPYLKAAEAERIGFECVPLLPLADFIRAPDAILALLERESFLGGPKIEGVVIKNYGRFGRDGKILAGKHVSEAFKEVHQKAWKTANPGRKDVIETLVAGLRTEARWDKAYQHLRDSGKLTGTPRDIGPLMAEVQRDVEAEEWLRIQETLFKWAWPLIRRRVAAGLPEWYKKRLLQAQFEVPIRGGAGDE